MTREEAIKILKAIRVYECYPKSASEETKEAIDMAIDALSAEAVHKPDYSYEADMVRRLKEALSAEVVEVVRCGECKNRGSDACPMFFEEWFTIDEGDGYVDDDYRIHDHTESDGYCHWGERKGGDEE